MKYILFIISALFIFSSCGRKSDDGGKPMLAVSIEPQRKILQDIVGDRYDVVSVLGQQSNPESYDPTMSQRMALARAQAYFTTGYLPFEPLIARSMGSGAKVVDTSVGIVPVKGTHGHHHSDDADNDPHGEADPHIWTSVRNSKMIAHNMLEAMCEIDPDNASAYNTAYLALESRLDSLDSALSRQLSLLPTRSFVVWHPSLSYFARDYGLKQIAAGMENKEMSVGSMANVIKQARADSARVFFFQKEYDTRQARNLNEEIGSTIVEINPLAYDWEAQLILTADALSRQ